MDALLLLKKPSPSLLVRTMNRPRLLATAFITLVAFTLIYVCYSYSELAFNSSSSSRSHSSHRFLDNNNDDDRSQVYAASNRSAESMETVGQFGSAYGFQLFDMELIKQIVSLVSVVLIMFGAVVPYMPQYRIIYQTRNVQGFSIFVCLTILLAHIFRILFWFGHPYETPLLVQSIFMFLCMMVMLELCVRIKAEENTESLDSIKRFTDFEWRHFWKWTYFASYLQCVLTIIAVMGTLTLTFYKYSPYIETVGFLSVFIEAMLPAPQLYRNFSNGSTEGMSVIMVCMWTSGDTFKVVYYLLRSSPIQFWICGILQASLDVAILVQVLVYGRCRRRASYDTI